MKLIKKIMEIILRKESKKIIKDYNKYIEQRQITPPETIKALKGVYTNEVANGKINENLKILSECIDTINKTRNPSIVLDRYEYGLMNAYSLRQLEDAGFYNGSPTATEYIELFIKNKNRYINECLDRCQNSKDEGTKDEVYLYRKKAYFTKEEEEMSFHFSMEHKIVLSRLNDEFYKLWLEQDGGNTIYDKIEHYKLTLEKLYEIRDFCINAGRGGEVYYIQNWEELFNSKNPCFSQEEVILGKINYFQKQKERLDSLKKISNNIVEIIEQQEEIYQKDLYKIFPNVDRQDIKDIVNELAANKIIIKTKKSNSYELRIEK
ncbi:hypothetical protein ACR77J_16585 [Tissierella praeacuta]|uniref:hypothetical protein n=1 Tax=Tissierella praeacuta TaxID=43131 RepID=UPI003DA61F4B